MSKLRTRQAIVAALREEMSKDPTVILLGEDVADAEGVFKTSEGLLEQFGPMRVRDTPISEMGFLGAAVGAAATGLRPVVEIMFMEFLGVALDMLVTQAAKFHYLSGGALRMPLTVRASVGSGGGFGMQHSQTLENWVSATPGLKVVMPSGPQAAYSLLRAAIRDDNPVIVLEPRALYAERDEVVTEGPGSEWAIGEARTVRSGEDVTVVGLGQTVRIALAAADAAAWSADVIDLATLVPWDRETVLASVRRTGRLVVVEESPLSGGWGHEIVSTVTTEAFTHLTAPPVRITCPDVPVPYSKTLETLHLPQPQYVRDRITQLVDEGRSSQHWWDGAR